MRNSTSCHVVADYFLLQIDPTAGDSISHLKLQKLVYYAQAWSLALRNEPLFRERVEAWAHGPVVPDLYQRFKNCGWQAIDPTSLKTDPLAQLSDGDVEHLDGVWLRYGKFTGRQLEDISHAEAPWIDAYGDTPQHGRCEEEITHDAMKRFYKAVRKRDVANTRAASA